MRRLLAIGAIVVVIIIIGYAIGSYLLFDQISSVSALCSERPSGGQRFEGNTPAGWSLADDGDVDQNWNEASRAVDLGPYAMAGYEEVDIPSRDADVGSLKAWWVPATAGAPAVGVVHGHGSCRRDHVVLLPAGMLHRAGFSVLLLDIRDMGDSPVIDGRYAGGTQEYADVLDARDWIVETQGVPASKVGLLGTSLGAATVIIAAGKDETVAATWEDSGYGDVELMIRDEIAHRGLPGWLNVLVPGGLAVARIVGIDPTAPTPLEMAAEIGTRPFAVVHGERDTHIPARHASDLAAVVAASIPGYEPWIIECAEHVEGPYCATAQYEDRLVEFFTDALGAPGGG